MDKVTNIKFKKNNQLKKFACFLCSSLDNYGLISLLNYSPNLELLKIHNCSCINDNIYEVIYKNTRKIRKKILFIDIKTFLINKENRKLIFNNNIEYGNIDFDNEYNINKSKLQ